ncbi:MAG: methylenetetrahydrofolate--tRNA-(uracil(54)-C(5))-methyltransferase (FADH(2)-oxidizing) TrmFO [Oscillospiraceae bacterium]|jgi:methylenetetrahydrofolate--tRNA-(uracil-5-)-methyltransferase|nr:methylenetetrahydrofolate--tRNA-(uracil(54)-C(5))-methyltransferase (FADH(2)-oxidizing) TrmFO [Oscillospiraceae bacterium]
MNNNNLPTVNVIGAGLAGCEAAWQLARRGVNVRLYEQKPNKKSAAHNSNLFAELVCSNSLKANRIASAAGMLKQELRLMHSLLIACADECSVPAGGALAVNRELFAQKVTDAIMQHPNITVVAEEVSEIPTDEVTIIATGPLTSDALSKSIAKSFNNSLYFFDAAAPIVSAESVDMEFAFYASRYDNGGETDYLNCPLNKAEYEEFYEAIISAQRAHLHSADESLHKVYEGCMPIEVLATRGKDTMRFGPMKPVGLVNPKTGHRPWAALQLRKEDAAGTMFNLVGFQTNLKFGEQQRVFGLIPALKNAEFLRFGVMHRNTFLDSPRVLNSSYKTKADLPLFFAGQITGVEGYVESISSGLMAGINAYNFLTGQPLVTLPPQTMTGALSRYISDEFVKDFQPMGANLGVLPMLQEQIRDKRQRAEALAQRGLEILQKDFAELL